MYRKDIKITKVLLVKHAYAKDGDKGVKQARLRRCKVEQELLQQLDWVLTLKVETALDWRTLL